MTLGQRVLLVLDPYCTWTRILWEDAKYKVEAATSERLRDLRERFQLLETQDTTVVSHMSRSSNLILSVSRARVHVVKALHV